MTDKIHEKVKSLLNDHALSDEDALVTSGRLSSLKVIELAAWIEETYHIDFSETEFNAYDFETVTSIRDMIKRKTTRAV